MRNIRKKPLLHTDKKKRSGSSGLPHCVTFLSSGWLTISAASFTAAAVGLLFIDDRSTALAATFTVAVCAIVVFVACMFATALFMIYYTFIKDGRHFNILVALDFYFMYLIGCSNVAMLFWVWDETDGRDSSFTNFDVINNPVEAWLASFYITTLAIQGFGYGRYVADSQLSETWIAIVNTLNPIVFGMVISSFVILALEFVKTNYSNQRQAKNYV